MQKLLFTLIVNFFISTSLLAQGGHKQVAEGNKLYEQEKYDEANNKYRDALIENPESPIVNFNIGDVQYKKRNFEEAMKSFDKATSSDDIMLQSQGYYNIGNTLYKLGKLPESILAYKKALELNPNDVDAKYNLEYVRAKLKDSAQKQNQQQQDPITPSEYAKKLKVQAEGLVELRKYRAAYELMVDGLKQDKTVAAYQDFISRIGDVIGING